MSAPTVRRDHDTSSLLMIGDIYLLKILFVSIQHRVSMKIRQLRVGMILCANRE